MDSSKHHAVHISEMQNLIQTKPMNILKAYQAQKALGWRQCNLKQKLPATVSLSKPPETVVESATDNRIASFKGLEELNNIEESAGESYKVQEVQSKEGFLSSLMGRSKKTNRETNFSSTDA
jgi:hypothetical protein